MRSTLLGLVVPLLCVLASMYLFAACATDEKAEVVEQTWDCMADADDPEVFETSMRMMFPTASNLEEAKEQYIYVSQAASLQDLEAARDEACAQVVARPRPTATAQGQTQREETESTQRKLPTPTPTPEPTRVETVWRYEVEKRALSTSVIVDERVYLAVYDTPMSALDVETGELLWQEARAEILGHGETSPNVLKGIVYVGVDALSGSGYIYALDADTGESLWRNHDIFPVVQVPTVVDGVVYVSSRDKGILALEAESGEPLTNYKVGALTRFSPYGSVSPTVEDGVLYSVLNTGLAKYAFAMELESSELLWQYELPGSMSGSPLVQGSAVYVHSTGIVFALDRTSGELRWQFEYAGTMVWDAVYKNTVFVRQGGGRRPPRDNPLYALDVETGELLWSYEGGQGYHPHAFTTLLDGVMYLGAEDGYLRALDADSGKELEIYGNVGTVLGVIAGSDGEIKILGWDGEYVSLFVGDAAR